MKYQYFINLDDRGSFRADVRRGDCNGETVFEIRAGNELEEDETSIFEDGYLKHGRDLAGLENYLKDLGIMKEGDELEMGQ